VGDDELARALLREDAGFHACRMLKTALSTLSSMGIVRASQRIKYQRERR
jgi:hypothetical protein